MQTVRTDGRAIRVRRAALGLTQTDLARTIGIDASTFSHVEAGRRSLTLSATFLVAIALQCTADDITVVVGEQAPEAAA